MQLPGPVARRAADLLPGDLPALRRLPATLLHLTLAFLGSVRAASAGPAGEALRAAARPSLPFTLRLEALGRFPETGPPAVVWLGTARGAAELVELAARLRAELAARDLPFDGKPFRPHVTLARLSPGASPDDALSIERALQAITVPRLDFLADRIQLVESVRSRKGSRYAQLEEAVFGGGQGA